ncbi:MAG: hypothetical protein N5P05_003700 [Chroococcopsis gigantea SAG 12.99]|jgi:hypothetical protein|nr:hypothetical protein [Chroococcopsis gigantea SAG 12.99]
MTETSSVSTLTTKTINWEVVHKIPGRIRLRIPRLVWDESYQNRLERLLLRTITITGSKFNKFAGCVTIFYKETITEPVILEYLGQAIGRAEREGTGETIPGETQENIALPAVAMATALIALPLELPLLLTGGLIIAASLPLWQRVSQSFSQQGEINVDGLDILWLTAQIAGGNHLAGALALNLGSISENLRNYKLKELGNELYILFEEEENIHWLSNRASFLPIEPEEGQKWLDSVEDTALMQQVKPIAQGAIVPTLIASAGVGLLTGDIGRASALLPLDLGVSLRGVTPLAVVSALTSAARSGAYIRNGKTLEKLAQVDTLVFSVNAFLSLIFSKQSLVPFEEAIQALRERVLSLYIVVDTEDDQDLIDELMTLVDKVFTVKDKNELDGAIDRLRVQGKTVAWIDDTTGDKFTSDRADVTITLARGNLETSADVILQNYDLRALVYTLDLARDTLKRAYGSLAIATIPNLIAVSIGVIWGLDPLIAVMINGGSAILAELNSLASKKPPIPSNRLEICAR